MSKTMRGLLIRTLIAITVAGLLYTTIVYIPRKIRRDKQQVHNAQLLVLRNLVDQNYITYSELAQLTGSNIQSAPRLAQARESLTASMTELKTALNKPPKQLSLTLKGDLESVLQTETTAAGQYDGIYNALSNPIFYNPSDDLAVDSNTITRADSAVQALTKLAKETQINVTQPGNSSSVQVFMALPGNAQAALLSSADCISNYVKQLNAKQTTDAKKTLASCTTGYQEVRKQLTAVIVGPLNGPYGKTVRSSLQTALAKIDKLH